MFGGLFEIKGGSGMSHSSQSNNENDPRPQRRKVLPLAVPWWDLSVLKPGLDRTQFVREMAGIQKRLRDLVLYLDSLEDRSVLVEVWHILERLRPVRREKSKIP